MIKVIRHKSYAGYDNCFDFSFRLKEYIPEEFFMQHEDGAGAELYFYISLFHQFRIFDCQPKHYHQDIWSMRYDCIIDGIWFSMIYDEDYDTVSFSVSPKNIEQIPEISEHIKTLIENDGMNVHLNDNDREL